MAANKRTQKRGICPYCLKYIAVTESGNLADHGYRNINGYKATNSCFGFTRHHLGHISAIEEMKNAIATFYDFMLNSKDAKSINDCAIEIDRLKALIVNFKEAQPISIDLDAIEKADREAKALAALEAKTARESKSVENLARSTERAEKARLKWLTILATNTHEIIKDKVVLISWIADYENRNDLEHDHYKRVADYMTKNGISDFYDRVGFSEPIVHKVKSSDTGKQLHKF